MKKAILVFMAMLISLMTIVAVQAAPTCTIVAPASSSANTGSIVFNATVTLGSGAYNVTGINYSVSGTVVGSDTSGINSSYYNATVDTSSITDTASTTVTANIIVNGTTLLGSCTSTSVAFDNTNPVCGCTIDRVNLDSFDPIGYDCSTSSDTTALTYSAVTTYADGSTETETDQSGQFDETYSLGEASVAFTVTDAVSKTNSCTAVTVTIANGGSGSGSTGTGSSSRKNTAIIVILVVLVVAVLASVIAMQSGKKRRKKKR